MKTPEQLPSVIADYPSNLNLGDKYYSHKFYCSNCGERNQRWILKGLLVKLQSIVCEECGCQVKG